MCGIAGYFGRVEPAAPQRVRRMLMAQRHRGPDGAGIASWSLDVGWRVQYATTPELLPTTEGSPSATCVIGHNLLAIQDATESARQPMLDGSLGLVFNGEIYNFVELRADLEKQGARFRTRGDTEVLLELWKRRGPDCLKDLRGMFAFAVFDAPSRKLWLVRDPFGIKPLYYTTIAGQLHFASEIRSLHAAGTPRKLLPDAAVACAAAGINAFGEGRTLYEEIHELPAGHGASSR